VTEAVAVVDKDEDLQIVSLPEGDTTTALKEDRHVFVFQTDSLDFGHPVATLRGASLRLRR
jgi:hypothetical protein